MEQVDEKETEDEQRLDKEHEVYVDVTWEDRQREFGLNQQGRKGRPVCDRMIADLINDPN